MASIAKVEPLTTARALRGPFDYRIPSRMEGVGVGTMLVVPFGRQRMLGVVVDVASESEIPPERLVEPVSALESGVPAELVRLGLWVAEDYCSTPARGLALVLPPGTGTRAPPPRRRARASSSSPSCCRPAEKRSPPARRCGWGRDSARPWSRCSDGPATAAELADAGADHATLRRLADRSLLSLERRPQRRHVAGIELGEHGEQRAEPAALP